MGRERETMVKKAAGLYVIDALQSTCYAQVNALNKVSRKVYIAISFNIETKCLVPMEPFGHETHLNAWRTVFAVITRTELL
jgi:hypothetical protein